jgi:hypothetical protein
MDYLGNDIKGFPRIAFQTYIVCRTGKNFTSESVNFLAMLAFLQTLLIYNLFCDAVSSSDCIEASERMIKEGSGHGLYQASIPTFAWRD